RPLGTFSVVGALLRRSAPGVVRFPRLRSRSRSRLTTTDASLADAKQALARLYTALASAPAGDSAVDWNEPHARRFKDAMDDDFGTPEAIAELHQLASRVFQGDAKAARQLKALGAVLGLLQRDPNDFLRSAPAGVAEE